MICFGKKIRLSQYVFLESVYSEWSSQNIMDMLLFEFISNG